MLLSIGEIVQSITGNVVPNSPRNPHLQELLVEFEIATVYLQTKWQINHRALVQVQVNALLCVCNVISPRSIRLILHGQSLSLEIGQQASGNLGPFSYSG
jgi:hypothetical protein